MFAIKTVTLLEYYVHVAKTQNDFDINCILTSKKNEENKYNHEIKLFDGFLHIYAQVRLLQKKPHCYINQHYTFLLALKFHGKNAYLMDCKIFHCTAWLLGQADVSEVNQQCGEMLGLMKSNIQILCCHFVFCKCKCVILLTMQKQGNYYRLRILQTYTFFFLSLAQIRQISQFSFCIFTLIMFFIQLSCQII